MINNFEWMFKSKFVLTRVGFQSVVFVVSQLVSQKISTNPFLNLYGGGCQQSLEKQACRTGCSYRKNKPDHKSM